MTRSKFKVYWMATVFIVLCAAFFSFKKSQDYELKIARAEKQRTTLTLKLNAGAQVSADLRALNASTIDQNVSTKLDVLRYMNMEDDDITLNEVGQTSRKVGRSEIFVRRFTLKPNSSVTYHEALRLVDRMYNNKSVFVNDITLKAGAGYGDSADIEIKGTFYGLEKRKK